MGFRTDESERGEGLAALRVQQRQRVRDGHHADDERERCEPDDQQPDQGKAPGEALLSVERTGGAVDQHRTRRERRTDTCGDLVWIGVVGQAYRHPVVVVRRVEEDSGLLGREQGEAGPAGQLSVPRGHDPDDLVGRQLRLARDDDRVPHRHACLACGAFVDHDLVGAGRGSSFPDEHVRRDLFIVGPVAAERLLGQPRSDDRGAVGAEQHRDVLDARHRCGDARLADERLRDR